MSAEFASNIDNDTETSVDKKSNKKRKESIFRVADKAIEREAEKPKSVYYGLEDSSKESKEKQTPESVLPPSEILKVAKNESDEEEETEESQAEPGAENEGQLKKAEKPEAIEKIAEYESENLPSIDSKAEKAAVAPDQAAQIFFENLKDKKDIEEAAAATYEELGIDAQEIENAKTEVAPEPEPVKAETVADGPQEFEAEVNLRTVEPMETATDETIDASKTPPPPAGGGNGGLPPHFLAGASYGGGGPAGHNTYTVPYGVAAGTTQEGQGHVPEYDQGNPAVTALIGGIIGYIIGKRRGRRLEQRKLLPVQKKLEKQVTDLHWQIKSKETEIRRVAARKAQIEGVAFMNALDRAVEKSQVKTDRREFRKMEQSTTPQRQPAPEAHHLHGSIKSHERIGHVLMAAETAAPILVRPEAAQAETARPIGDRRVETLNRAELLQFSEKVMVDGTSLRQIYESKLIGERGLRRLVAEHLRGGDVKKVLRQEIIEREIDFERDPLLRDQPVHSATGGTMEPRANPVQLNRLLAKAGASLPDSSEEAAFYRARAAYEVSEREQQQKQKQMMDTAFVAIIIGLLGLVIWLALSRG